MNDLIYLALRELYPTVVRSVGEIAYDLEGNQVSYDLNAINAKIASDAQSQASAKASALAKLTALGLTQAEITALIA